MNLLLSDDYLLQDYPENITSTLRSGHATCLRFNRRGDHLASGRVDGTVVVWDLETMGVARKLRGHSKQVNSLSWSRCGRYLLSACVGARAILWDLQDGRRYREVCFRAAVYIAELNPVNHHNFVVALYEEQPYLVDVTDPVDVKHVLPSVPRRIDAELDPAPREKQAKEDAKISTTSVLYTSTGEHIISATSKGQLNLIDAATCEIIYSEKVSSGMITGVRLSRSGKEIVVNALDRIVRTFHVPTKLGPGVDPDTIRLPLEHKFQDVVNKLSWNHVTFSGTGEYVAASTYNNHELYIWERQHGSLVRMLEGPKEEQGPLEWHPHRPMLAACGLETGRIYIWSVATPQKWSALAPDFEEVEENVEYSENEDEFDRHPQEEIHKRRIDAEERGDVEVLAPNTTTAASASASALADAAAAAAFDDDDPVTTFSGAAGVFRMPVLFDLGESDSEEEFVAVSAGTMRRKSYGEGGGEEGGTENGYRAASVGVAADGGEGMAAGAGGGSGRATPTASANGASASAGRSAAAKKGSARSGARGKAKGKS